MYPNNDGIHRRIDAITISILYFTTNLPIVSPSFFIVHPPEWPLVSYDSSTKMTVGQYTND